MKSLRALRETLVVEHDMEARGPHVYSPGFSPPNILILKRKTVRSYSSTERVALYYNEKLQRYFSVPFSVGRDDARDDVVGVSEEQLAEISTPTATRAFHARQERGQNALKHKNYHSAITHFKKANRTLDLRAKKYQKADRGEVVESVELTEDAISHLQKVKEFHTNTPLHHKDGTSTRIDPTTAHALLTVHSSLHPDNQKKFADALEHSKEKFHKMLDFAWSQVKS